MYLGTLLLSCWASIHVSEAAWNDSPRYSQQYSTGFQANNSPGPPCAPCQTSNDYRGNGADNLGYDWSPSAWGGLAFPSKDTSKTAKGDWRRDGCRPCDPSRQYPDRGFDSVTENPNYRDDVQGSMVTSSVLSIRHPNDKRLPVGWSGEGRSMRWDGFRNGMPWDRADKSDLDSTPSWENNSQRSSNYASDWSYQGGSSNKWNERPSNPSWAGPSDRGYPDRGSSWQPSTQPPYSPSSPNRPNYPAGGTTDLPQNSIPHHNRPYEGSQSWNYNKYDRPTGANQQHQTNRPSYLDNNIENQNPYKPNNGAGTPGTAIWNGGSYEANNKPKKPGYYMGFITEIHDPKYGQSNNQYMPKPDTNRPYFTAERDRYDTRPPYSSTGTSDRYPTTRPPYSNEYNPSRPVYNGVEQSHQYHHQSNNFSPTPPYDTNRRPLGDSDNNRPHSSSDRQPPYAFDHRPHQNNAPPTRYPYDHTDPSLSGNAIHGSDRYANRPYRPRDPYNDRGTQQETYGQNFGPGNDRPNYGANNQWNEFGSGMNNHQWNNRPNYGTSQWDNRPSYGTNNQGNERPNYGSNNNWNERPSYGTTNQWASRPSYGSNSQGSDRPSYGSLDRPSYGSNNQGSDRPSYGSNNHGSDRPSYGSNNQGSDRPSYGSSNLGNDRPNYGSNNQWNNRIQPINSDRDRGPNQSSSNNNWNYGEEDEKDRPGDFRRAGGSYPPFKGGQYFTSSYLSTASTPSPDSQELGSTKHESTESPT